MKHTTFIFAGIMSAIIGNAYATGENTVTSKSYVDAQDALKQDLITTSMVTTDGKRALTLPSLITYDTTNGLTGGITGILSSSDITEDVINWWYDNAYKTDKAVPTMELMFQFTTYVEDEFMQRQLEIPASGYSRIGGNNDDAYNTNSASDVNTLSWLSADVAGTGLVTKTSIDGRVGERKIFEETDVSGYHAQNLTQIQKDIQDISIPTVGAMMTAISNGVNAATPTGTPNTIANYGANGELDSGIATYTGAAAYNATNDSAKIPTMAGVATYAQAKMTCAGWPDGVAHTDANCWLWNKN